MITFKQFDVDNLLSCPTLVSDGLFVLGMKDY